MKPVIRDYPVITHIWTFPVLQAALRWKQIASATFPAWDDVRRDRGDSA